MGGVGDNTGANSRGKPGKFELANRGTIFLDEVGDLPLEMQPKILRVLEEKEFERIGGNKIIRSDFRLIAATNRNLEEMMNQDLFRRDLFYRMNVISLNIPPLRDRKEDIWLTANHLLDKLSEEMYKSAQAQQQQAGPQGAQGAQGAQDSGEKKPGGGKKEEDVVDADYKVDEEKKD